MVQKQESPRTLTGGQAVHSIPPTKALLDWLQVTFKGEKTAEEIAGILGLGKVEFTLFSKGFYGYKNMIGIGNIMIMFNDDQTEWHVQMTGQGCRMFEQISEKTWFELLEYINLDEHASTTRIDLAIDSFNGIFTIPTIRRKMVRGELVTKFNKGNHTEEFKFVSDELGNSPVTGDGVRFGSPTSRFMIRMYDKHKERLSQDCELTVDKWLRVELQIRKEYSNDAVKDLVESNFDVGRIAMGYLKEYLRFVDKGKDSNKRRWKVSNFWAKYLKDVEPLKLSLEAPDKTIQKTIKWLDHAIAPSLAMVYEAMGEDYYNRFVVDMKNEGKERMKKTHEAIVDEYKEKEKIKKLINKNKMDELKKKMATIRKNRNQLQRKKHDKNVYMNYSMNNKMNLLEELPGVLEKPKKRITLLEDTNNE